ncbi:hypothetical protein ABZP36_034995 [Zizania latifolia]
MSPLGSISAGAGVAMATATTRTRRTPAASEGLMARRANERLRGGFSPPTSDHAFPSRPNARSLSHDPEAEQGERSDSIRVEARRGGLAANQRVEKPREAAAIGVNEICITVQGRTRNYITYISQRDLASGRPGKRARLGWDVAPATKVNAPDRPRLAAANAARSSPRPSPRLRVDSAAAPSPSPASPPGSSLLSAERDGGLERCCGGGQVAAGAQIGRQHRRKWIPSTSASTVRMKLRGSVLNR